jgi:hypothetical protein
MGLLDSLNPVNLVKSAAEAAVDSVLPDNLKAIGNDLADVALDVATGDYGDLLGDVTDSMRDAEQALGLPSTTSDLLPGQSAQPDSPPTAGPAQSASVAPATVASTKVGDSSAQTASSVVGSPQPAVASPATAPAAAAATSPTLASATDTASAARAATATTVSKTTGAADTTTAAKTTDAKDITTFFAQSDTDLMAAVRDGKLPDAVKNDPASMQRLQLRMNEISEMNQLISQMLAAMHEMNKAVIQNIRA